MVAAAISIADAESLDAISMRRVANSLGFEVMSLYNHVANKDDLVEAMVDAALADVDPPVEDDWREDVRAVALALRAALVRHRWVTQLWPLAFPGEHRWRLAERLLSRLLSAGLSDQAADLGFHIVVNHIVGFSHLQSGYAQAAGEAEGRDRFNREVDLEAFPALIRHQEFHLGERAANRPDEFTFVLDLILTGVAADLSDDHGP